MVNYEAALDLTFAALADRTRRAILARLAHGEASVTELAQPFDMSLPAVSKHLRVLEEAGLLARTRDGRVHRLRVAAAPMKQATEWMERYRAFWEARLDALDRYLTESKQEVSPWPNRKPSKTTSSRSAAPSTPRAKQSSAPGPTRKR
ncbi:MAG: winged helix-turn-helix transcriptional regulator [Pseudomonadota bacterium]|nr:MAG: winged helix-turn-helix transcriptional regulator [Pseudomonadota bacterium]